MLRGVTDMESMNEEIRLLHQCYCTAMGIGEMPLVPYYERLYCEAVNAGITCEDIRMVIADRQRRIRDGVRHRECLLLRNVIGSDEAIGNLMNEASMLLAKARVKPVNAGKLEVLRATGREEPKPVTDAVPIGKVIEEMRKAAG